MIRKRILSRFYWSQSSIGTAIQRSLFSSSPVKCRTRYTDVSLAANLCIVVIKRTGEMKLRKTDCPAQRKESISQSMRGDRIGRANFQNNHKRSRCGAANPKASAILALDTLNARKGWTCVSITCFQGHIFRG